jgi:uncharacterized protein (DUF2235 family)
VSRGAEAATMVGPPGFAQVTMPKNLVICCDGTNCQFGPENTNVVRLAQVLDRNPDRQRLYYDPGVGTLPEPSAFTRFQKWISKVYGLAFGAGLLMKVGEAYEFLMDFWEQGDQVFLFGFSRGAYTARVLAGLLYNLGLLPRGNANLVPYVIRLHSSLRDTGPTARDAGYWDLCAQFRWSFAREVVKGDDERRFPVHFVGLWDTVSSVGWVWDPPRYPYTSKNPGIAIARHAVSVDERRWFFRQNLLQPADRQDLTQLWFPGAHSDVGGGYPLADGQLWRVPFEWILDEAAKAGLPVDAGRRQEVLGPAPTSPPAWDAMQHESLTGLWWLAEYFPKMVRNPTTKRRSPEIGRGRYRTIRDGDVLHNATLRRIREIEYAPPNLSEAFRQRVKALGVVPDSLPYQA